MRRTKSIQLAQAPKVKPIVWWALGGTAVVLFLLLRKKPDAPKSTAAREEAAKDVINQIESGAGRADVAQTLFRAISAEIPSLPYQSKLMVIAQAITETGWNTGRAALKATNFWNITAGPAWKGPIFLDVNGDRSYTPSNCKRVGRPMAFTDSEGRPYCKIDQKWRKYDTVNEAVRDYWSFLGPKQNRGRYVKARGLLEAGDIEGFVRELRTAGYYDAPVTKYLGLMNRIIASLPKYLSAQGTA